MQSHKFIKLLAFPFNIILIVCAIVNGSSAIVNGSSAMFYHCDLLCTNLRVFM